MSDLFRVEAIKVGNQDLPIRTALSLERNLRLGNAFAPELLDEIVGEGMHLPAQ